MIDNRETTAFWLIRRNLGFPIAAALFMLSALGFLADVVRTVRDRPHPLMMAFAVSTVIWGLLLIGAQRRLMTSFRYGRAGKPK